MKTLALTLMADEPLELPPQLVLTSITLIIILHRAPGSAFSTSVITVGVDKAPRSAPLSIVNEVGLY